MSIRNYRFCEAVGPGRKGTGIFATRFEIVRFAADGQIELLGKSEIQMFIIL